MRVKHARAGVWHARHLLYTAEAAMLSAVPPCMAELSGMVAPQLLDGMHAWGCTVAERLSPPTQNSRQDPDTSLRYYVCRPVGGNVEAHATMHAGAWRVAAIARQNPVGLLGDTTAPHMRCGRNMADGSAEDGWSAIAPAWCRDP